MNSFGINSAILQERSWHRLCNDVDAYAASPSIYRPNAAIHLEVHPCSPT